MGMTFILGLSRQTYSLHLARSKSNTFITSILLTRSTSQIVNISGYLRGLSCPSGTDRIMAFFTAPVSNSAGQTRFPMFSRIARSTSSVPRLCSPCRVMLQSMWHIPPVCSWITLTPVFSMAAASTSASISASMMPMRSSSFRAAMVWRRVVVLPEPGELMRFRRKVWLFFSSSRSWAARRSLFSNTLCLTSITLNSAISKLLIIAFDPPCDRHGGSYAREIRGCLSCRRGENDTAD